MGQIGERCDWLNHADFIVDVHHGYKANCSRNRVRIKQPVTPDRENSDVMTALTHPQRRIAHRRMFGIGQ